MTQSRRTSPLPAGWHRTRAKRLKHDRHQCTLCGAKATHVDHIVPSWQNGGEQWENLRSLCESCHNSKTGREAREAQIEYRRRAKRRDPAPWEPSGGRRGRA